MSKQLTRRDFVLRTVGFGVAMGLAPAAMLAEAEQALRSGTSSVIADPYSVVNRELVATLKQFPVYDLSLEMVEKFRQMPGMPRVACSCAAAGGAAYSRAAGSTRRSCLGC